MSGTFFDRVGMPFIPTLGRRARLRDESSNPPNPILYLYF